MKSHKAFGDAYEHLFYLGCHLRSLKDERLDPTESIYRALYLPPFHPSFILSLYQLADSAELTYCVVSDGFNWQWFGSVIDAFDNARPIPTDLPETYRFHIECQALSTSQLKWFENEMAALEPLSIQSSQTPNVFNYRDGMMMRGMVRLQGGETHKFDLRPIDEWEKHPDQLGYYVVLYKLAASVFQDNFSVARLLEMQRYFFGFNTVVLKTFAFELIS